MKDIHNILNIKSNNIKPGRGKILISEPLMGDFYFKRSVVLLAEHNEEGSFGLIMNKPLSAKFNEIVRDFPDFETNLYLGGPVQSNNLFFIHTLGEKIEGSEEIIKGIYWGGDIEQIKDMIKLSMISPDEIRFYIGYSGWAGNQLDGELKKNSWLVSRIRAGKLLKANPEELWDMSIAAMGGEYAHWTNFPSDPTLN
ncbi:MAG: YqgE/AlgH family protein [Bacteroidota bacterium]|nr:YqgE/AlgH family protein [Bacteroidota bacterium]